MGRADGASLGRRQLDEGEATRISHGLPGLVTAGNGARQNRNRMVWKYNMQKVCVVLQIGYRSGKSRVRLSNIVGLSEAPEHLLLQAFSFQLVGFDALSESL